MKYIRSDGKTILFNTVLENKKNATLFTHFKGKQYKILTIATDSETREDIVVYQALYDDYRYFTRKADMFFSLVDTNKYPDVTQKYRFMMMDE